MLRVSLRSSFSSFVPLQSGVPQGSVLGPLLFSLYTCSIVQRVHSHGLDVHLFADDILIYGSSSPSESPCLGSRVSRCLEDVHDHFSSLRLLLNPDKTKILWCQSPRSRTSVASPITFNGTVLHPEMTVKYLGVVLDSHLSFSSNVTRTSCTCFSMLRRVRSVKSYLPRPLLVTLISSLVLSRLDYCISVHAGLPNCTLWRLQRVIHAASRVVFGARCSDHIQSLLRALTLCSWSYWSSSCHSCVPLQKPLSPIVSRRRITGGVRNTGSYPSSISSHQGSPHSESASKDFWGSNVSRYGCESLEPPPSRLEACHGRKTF